MVTKHVIGLCIALMALQQQPKLFETLTGSWIVRTSRGTVYEAWDSADSTGMKGKSFFLQQKDTVILEYLEIRKSGTDWHYIATVPGQNDGKPVVFKLEKQVGNYYQFENAKHDFPSRIIYELVNKDSIHTRIEGRIEGKDQAQDFYFSRIR